MRSSHDSFFFVNLRCPDGLIIDPDRLNAEEAQRAAVETARSLLVTATVSDDYHLSGLARLPRP
jgi:hypothetical protein